MTYNSHENIVLVAPRPVRLAAPTPYTQYHATSILHRPPTRSAVRFVSSAAEAFDRLKLSDDPTDDDAKSESPAPSERDRSVSPRASPRSTLPSEAIEEFLSILRPSTFLFPPTSPILRPSNGTMHGIVSYRRPGSCTLSPSITNEGLGISFVDQGDNASRDGETVSYPFKIFNAGHLSSPVSRTLTRNPFPRQATFEDTVSSLMSQRSASLSSAGVALSPAAVPLPLPTPDEMEHSPVF